MAKDRNTNPASEDQPENPAENGATPAADAAGATPASEGEFVEAEGPDVETSLSDSDLSFLDDVSQGKDAGGASQPPEPDPESEFLLDLRRVTADFANYRKRVERDRTVERERAIGDAVRAVLPVLDDLDRAEKHGDLASSGPMTAIAQKLRASVEKLGVTPFGVAGEAFDPTLHEAIFQKPNADVTAPTVADVVERGYRSGESVLRAAKVVVDTPSDG